MNNPVLIGVVGLGTMGLGIAQVFAQAGFQVLATDGQQSARESAKPRLATTLDERVRAGKLTAAQRDETLARLSIVADVPGLAAAGIVIEAIIESLPAKQELFAQLEDEVAESAVLATNTSSLSVAAMARGLRNPSRCLGLHFFNPAPAMRLVELVLHDGVAASAAELARDVTEAAGKTVVSCADRPGFIVNRCARPFYGEALAMLEEGRSASDIDASMVAAGYRMGPFSLIDLIGVDINLAATRSLHEAMDHHPRYHVFESLTRQAQSGKIGRKSGKGFIYPATPGTPPADAPSIALRIEAVLANEAAYLLGEGNTAETGIESALKLGLNFPRGPFESARTHGLSRVRKVLDELESRAPAHLKGRYRTAPALAALV